MWVIESPLSLGEHDLQRTNLARLWNLVVAIPRVPPPLVAASEDRRSLTHAATASVG
jgi:hypothetical protein